MQWDPAPSHLCLAHHRIVGRALRADVSLIDEAAGVVDAWLQADPSPPEFAPRWQRILLSPPDEIIRQIGGRTSEAERLRGCSPFALTPSRLLTREQVHRLWGLEASHATRILPSSEYRQYAEHLKKLSRRDRINRFFAPVNDDWIDRFVEIHAKEPTTTVICHYAADLALDGVVQVCLMRRGGEGLAEIGLSVLPEVRHRGLGVHLLERGLLWARNHGASRFYALFAVDNEIMFRLARHCRMEVSFGNGSVEGVIPVLPFTPASIAEELLDNQIGEWDYHAKAHDAAFRYVVNDAPTGSASRRDLERLVRLAQSGRTEIIATYVIVFRYALIESGVSVEDHTLMLAALRERLQPLVANHLELRTYISGLPTSGRRGPIRFGLWRPVLSH